MQQFYILRKQPFRETNSLFTLLTQDDHIIKVIGSDQTKIKCQIIQSFQRLEAHIKIGPNASLHTMRKPEHLSSFHFIGPHVFAGMYLNELIIKLSDTGIQSAGLFDLYQQSLTDLSSSKPLAPTIRKFEIKWLALQGYGIDLTFPDSTPLSVLNGQWNYNAHSPFCIKDIKNILQDNASSTTCGNIRTLLHQMIAALIPQQPLNTLKWLQSVYC